MPLHFKARGGGEPLILLHGLFGSLGNLGGIARVLAETYKVYSVDLPNHGLSPHTESTSLEAMARTLQEWLVENSLEGTHIVGHSLGGKVAMEMALIHPASVKSLVVMDIAPVHYDPHHHEVFNGLLAIDLKTTSNRREAEGILSEQVEEAAVRNFLMKNLVKQSNGGFMWRMNLPVIRRHYADLIKANRDDSSFDKRTLFLKGGDSDYIREQYRDEILKRFPCASLKIVANTGHWLHAEKPEVVARLVSRFLQKDEES